MINHKIALILGATGQDGAHLSVHLIKDGWTVYCGFRRGSGAKTWRFQHLGVLDKIHLVNVNIDEPFNLINVLKSIKPKHIYHFAGESFVADSFIHPISTLQANTLGTLNILEAIRQTVPLSTLFFASSSEIFGSTISSDDKLNENSLIKPSNPYGISKMTAQHLVRMYRDTYGQKAIIGILFNHEGPLRERNFVTRKISYNLAKMKLAKGQVLELGSLDASRDWGSAEDYTQAMVLTLESGDNEDYIFATGKLTSVREFLSFAAMVAGFQPIFEGQGLTEICIDKTTGKQLARVSKRYFRAFDTSARKGDASKLTQTINWEGSRSVEQMVTEMVLTDMDRIKKGITNV